MIHLQRLGPGMANLSTKTPMKMRGSHPVRRPPFPLVPMALIMTATSILTTQQLSETEYYRRQFALLSELGMARRAIAHALRNQFAIYYTVPHVLIAVPFILHLAQMSETECSAKLLSVAADGSSFETACRFCAGIRAKMGGSVIYWLTFERIRV